MTDWRVYHIAQDGGVHLITEESEHEARKIADGLQDLNYQGLLPETFYMCAPCGSSSDVSWMLKSLRPTNGTAPVDYMAVYEQAMEEKEKRQASINNLQLKRITTRGRKSSLYGNLQS